MPPKRDASPKRELPPDYSHLATHGWARLGNRFSYGGAKRRPGQKHHVISASFVVDYTKRSDCEPYCVETMTIGGYDRLFDLLNIEITPQYLFDRLERAVHYREFTEGDTPPYRNFMAHFEICFLVEPYPERLSWLYDRYACALWLGRPRGKDLLTESGAVACTEKPDRALTWTNLALSHLGNLRPQRVHVCVIYLALALGCTVPILEAFFWSWVRRDVYRPDPINPMPIHFSRDGDVMRSW